MFISDKHRKPKAILVYNMLMDIVKFILIAEAIVAFILIAWLVNKAHKHVKHSPAEIALREHLAELQSVKAAKNELKK